MKQLAPYLTFNGTCREAMMFYADCLGAEVMFQTVGESPMAAQMPPATHSNIMHSMLTKDNFALMASDMIAQGDLVRGNTITLCLVCSSKEEIETFFSKLSQGGKIGQPLKEEFFGMFGSLTDKFGMNWMFQFDNGK